MAEEEIKYIIDSGTGYTKVGISEEMRAIFPSYVGYPNLNLSMTGGKKKIYAGRNAKEKIGYLKIEYPIIRGVINDWENMEELWNYSLCERIGGDDYSFTFLDPIINPKINREKIVKDIF